MNQIRNCTIIVLCLIISMLTSGLKATEVDSIHHAKQRVEHQLAEDLDTLNQLKKVLGQRVTHGPLSDLFEKAFNQVSELKRFVEKQSPEVLPSALVALLIDKSNKSLLQYLFFNNSQSPFMTLLYPAPKSYLVALGQWAVEPLIKSYNRTQKSKNKEYILDILVEIGSSAILPLIRQEIHSANHRIQIKAIRLLPQLMGEEAISVLSQLLLEGQTIQSQEDGEIIEIALRQIKDLNQSQWLATIIGMIQAKKLPSNYLGHFHYQFEEFPGAEDVIGKHIPFLLTQLSDENYLGKIGQKNAVMLLSLLKHRVYLKQLFPMLDKLLKVCFSYGEIVGLHDLPQNPYFCLNSTSAWNSTYAQLILRHIEAGLLKEDIQQWLDKQPKSSLTKLYLEQWLIKKGEFPKPISLENLLIAVTVSDSQNRIIASQRHQVLLGKKVVLKGKPQVPGYPIHTYSASFSIDTERLQIVMDSFLIDFKPHGARFDGRMPFGGGLEIKFHEKVQGKRQVLKWLIRHIDEEAGTEK